MLLLDANADGAWDIGRDDDPRTLHDDRAARVPSRRRPEALIDVVDPPAGPAPKLAPLDLAPLHALGWQPEVELEDGMRRTLDWLSSPA